MPARHRFRFEVAASAREWKKIVPCRSYERSAQWNMPASFWPGTRLRIFYRLCLVETPLSNSSACRKCKGSGRDVAARVVSFRAPNREAAAHRRPDPSWCPLSPQHCHTPIKTLSLALVSGARRELEFRHQGHVLIGSRTLMAEGTGGAVETPRLSVFLPNTKASPLISR
jgi:hypothetical protein